MSGGLFLLEDGMAVENMGELVDEEDEESLPEESTDK